MITCLAPADFTMCMYVYASHTCPVKSAGAKQVIRNLPQEIKTNSSN